MFALKSELDLLDREFQREGEQDFINDCTHKILNRFPDLAFDETDVRDFMIGRADFDVYDFKLYL